MALCILEGDTREHLAKMPSNHFDCVVTSPPYWGLRDYGTEGQLGMEPTLEEHIENMVSVCGQIRRVLKADGTFWLNYGDCYAGGGNGGGGSFAKDGIRCALPGADKSRRTRYGRRSAPDGLKPKDLCMVPNRVAIALQDAGWWVRSEIIWAKPNPMPESVTDRPTTAHEKIWLLTKSARYFYDADRVRQRAAETSIQRWSQDISLQAGSSRANGGRKTNGAMKAVGGPKKDKQRGHGRRHDGFNDRWNAMPKDEQPANGRHLRNYEPAPVEVWPMATRPFSEAHFATFPPELVERCLKAGCPRGGRVLDPFGGAGTTGLVADRMGYDCTLIEINPDYIEISQRRISKDRGPLLGAMMGDI